MLFERYYKPHGIPSKFRIRIAERFLKADGNVKRWPIALVVLVVAACRGERASVTTTVAPAEPRPAPTQTATMDDRPIVTTSGSPAPASAPAPGTAFVTVSATGISMRGLIPRGHTAFHIVNQTRTAHDLVLQSASGGAVQAAVAPADRRVVQARLTERSYSLVCTSPGHAERAEFTTYAPGTPIR